MYLSTGTVSFVDDSKQVPPFMHGDDAHSFTSAPQLPREPHVSHVFWQKSASVLPLVVNLVTSKPQPSVLFAWPHVSEAEYSLALICRMLLTLSLHSAVKPAAHTHV